MQPSSIPFPLLAFLAILGCKPATDSTAPTPTPARDDSDAGPELPPMAEHFIQASRIKDRIIRGELDRTREPARWLLANVVADELPVRWRPHVPRVHDAARMVENARTLGAAAEGAAQLALACGTCHQDVGANLSPGFIARPLDDSTTFGHMDRHGYAVARMWEGLVGPSDPSWTEGAEMLSEAPLHGDDMPHELKDLASRVHGLAASAGNQTDPAERAGHFAEILMTCTDCHSAVRD